MVFPRRGPRPLGRGDRALRPAGWPLRDGGDASGGVDLRRGRCPCRAFGAFWPRRPAWDAGTLATQGRSAAARLGCSHAIAGQIETL